jgi:8-hydroxy-5-deazaflavin:NADPH oxidoreductase
VGAAVVPVPALGAAGNRPGVPPVGDGMTTLGIIGAGHIGSQVARAAIGVGYDVVIANSRDPQTLADLAAETGATAVWATDCGAVEACPRPPPLVE